MVLVIVSTLDLCGAHTVGQNKIPLFPITRPTLIDPNFSSNFHEKVPPQFVHQHVVLCEQPLGVILQFFLEVKLNKKLSLTYPILEGHVTGIPL